VYRKVDNHVLGVTSVYRKVDNHVLGVTSVYRKVDIVHFPVNWGNT
jgi:hypothetical protein